MAGVEWRTMNGGPHIGRQAPLATCLGEVGKSDVKVQQAPELLAVEPRKINLATHGLNSTARPTAIRTALKSGDPELVMGGDWDNGGWGTGLLRVEELDVYTALQDCLANGGSWEETGFYQRVKRQIATGTPRWGCKTEADLRRRLSVTMQNLFESIKSDGYMSQTQLDTGMPQDEIRVGIRRDGRFVMFDGRHRLSIAKILGLASVPVNVVVRHEHWVAFKDEIRSYAQERLNGRVYQQLDHPDLASIPAKHGTERLKIIWNGLEGYAADGKRLLDLGTHWGYMAQQMERMGFRCTGVEADPDSVRFARRLRVATESTYEIWDGNLLDYPGGEFSVVFALSIFHHMIKTEQRHERLKEMLGRLSTDVMIFEPHGRESAVQMQGAYRDYSPEEFAGFVAEHAGLRTIEYLGTPGDRYKRPIFKLSS